MYCITCNQYGHTRNKCKYPITSYGIIAFTYIDDKLHYLMIRRKNSYGYIEFVRNKYSFRHIDQLQDIIDEMTIQEKHDILFSNFEKIFWTRSQDHLYLFKKILQLREGVKLFDQNKTIRLHEFVNSSKTNWVEQEWEFPKGRKNAKETDLDAAVREFEEETGIPAGSIDLVENMQPIEELFMGSNLKTYKHKYFVAFIDTQNGANPIDLTQYQKGEVSKIVWKSYDECIDIIRPYNIEKKQMIAQLNVTIKRGHGGHGPP